MQNMKIIVFAGYFGTELYFWKSLKCHWQKHIMSVLQFDYLGKTVNMLDVRYLHIMNASSTLFLHISEEVSNSIKDMWGFFWQFQFDTQKNSTLHYIHKCKEKDVYKEKQAESQNRKQHHQEISEVFTHCPVNILLFIFC